MTRATYRFREFRLIPDTEPDAEPLTFALQCAVCEQSGEPGPDQGDAHGWATSHLKTHPEHYTYREIITRPRRFAPGAWQ
jgi:hypothetical protein